MDKLKGQSLKDMMVNIGKAAIETQVMFEHNHVLECERVAGLLAASAITDARFLELISPSMIAPRMTLSQQETELSLQVDISRHAGEHLEIGYQPISIALSSHYRSLQSGSSRLTMQVEIHPIEQPNKE